METPPDPAAPSSAHPHGPTPGSCIGPYKLLGNIGQGGMGTVYLAVRADDQYRQRVAIKLIRPGMGTDAINRRFRNERQILAGLNHPNIVKLLDGGITEHGLSYFAMDYVEGAAIDVYCDTHQLATAERLALFRTICAAVQYAHQNLVIHCDLKPSNILVTADGSPKLLDFGIAKLLKPEWSADAIEPTARPPMTPEYASPEQVRGGPVTTASDVYGLGVLLYELLTGARPYPVQNRRPEEIAQIVCETEPAKPSVARRQKAEEIGKTDGQRAKSEERRAKELAGDLDNIVLMAMRKEPQRRYASVEQLSEDIGRHLEGLPVRARKDTLAYRSEKFFRRHRAGVAAALLIAGLLLAGVATTTWQARVARRERARAEQRFNDVRRLANSFIFEFHDAVEKLPGSTAAQELLVKRALEYIDSLAKEASGDASLQMELAAAYARLGNIQWNRYYANLGDRAGALQSQRKALSIRAAVAADSANWPARRELTYSYLAIGDVLAATGDLNGALEHYHQSRKIREAAPAARAQEAAARRELAITYQRIGDTLGNPGFPNLGDRAGAREYYRKMQTIFEALAAADRPDPQDRHSLAIGYEKFGRLLAAEGDPAGALELYRKELAIFQASAAAAPNNARFRRDVAVGYGNIGDALAQLGDYAGALENYRAALQIRAALVAADRTNAGARRDLAQIQDVTANTLAAKGDLAGAVEYYRQALPMFEDLYAADAQNQAIRTRLARTLSQISALLVRTDQKAQARRHVNRLLAILKTQADRPAATLRDLNDYAWTLLTCEPADLREPRAARTYAERAAQQTQDKDPAILDTLALACHLTGDHARAVEKESKALTLLPPDSPRSQEMAARLATFQAAADRATR